VNSSNAVLVGVEGYRATTHRARRTIEVPQQWIGEFYPLQRAGFPTLDQRVAASGAKLPFTGMSVPGVERKWDFGTFRSVDGPRLCKNAVLVGRAGAGSTEPISCSDRLYQSADAQNAHYPFHIVGQDV
jgi:hypothetical protein